MLLLCLLMVTLFYHKWPLGSCQPLQTARYLSTVSANLLCPTHRNKLTELYEDAHVSCHARSDSVLREGRRDRYC